MSILLYNFNNPHECVKNSSDDERYKRDLKLDINKGLDCIFELREKLNQLHPTAKDIVIRMLHH
jgi:hypothetical protein